MLKIYFDGGCQPNPGMMEVAVVARGRLHHRRQTALGTSEQAEWLALLHALNVAEKIGERDILLLGDSAGVINQAVNGARVRSLELQACRERFRDHVQRFDRVRVRHIARRQNLAGIALGQIRDGRRIIAGKEPLA